MASAVLAADGQTTIPEEVRERLNLKPGDRIEFLFKEDGSAVMVPLRGRAADLAGMVAAKEHKTLEQIDEDIRKRAATR